MIGLHFWLRVRPWYARGAAGWRWSWRCWCRCWRCSARPRPGGRSPRSPPIPLGPPRPLPKCGCPRRRRRRASARSRRTLSWFFAGMVGPCCSPASCAASGGAATARCESAIPMAAFIDVIHGTSVLEASRLPGIPHAHVCGGRGRCSTCRVRVRGEIGSLDPPGDSERRVLRRIGANAQCPPRLPVAADGRGPGDAAAAALRPCARRAPPGRFRPGQRARDRDPVRRYPRLHRTFRRPAAL